MKIFKLLIIFAIIAVLVFYFFAKDKKETKTITNFIECAEAGNPIMESYPRQCVAKKQTYVENIGNELEKINLIRLTSPRPNDKIKSPLTIKGEARGIWFFEGSFPVFLTDWDGKIIAKIPATAKGEWMTENFVPFEAVLEFKTPDDIGTFSNSGTLILRKDNPSDLREHDDALEIPIFFR